MPPSVASIGSKAFERCERLTGIIISSAATTIVDDPDTIPATTTIMGYAISNAHDYAKKYDRTFKVWHE
jgi:hypothetical protein